MIENRKAERSRQWRRDNPDRYRDQQRAAYDRDRDRRLEQRKTPEARARKAELRNAARRADPVGTRLKFRAWNYGLSLDALTTLLDAGCSACGSAENLHVDHDHVCCPAGSSPRSCGRCVRGVLCHGCNTALGLLGEDPARIEGLLEHIKYRGEAWAERKAQEAAK